MFENVLFFQGMACRSQRLYVFLAALLFWWIQQSELTQRTVHVSTIRGLTVLLEFRWMFPALDETLASRKKRMLTRQNCPSQSLCLSQKWKMGEKLSIDDNNQMEFASSSFKNYSSNDVVYRVVSNKHDVWYFFLTLNANNLKSNGKN